jgi:Arc/MetJ family transcription regulator
MTVILIVSIVFLVFIVGLLLAFVFSRADHVVTHTRNAMVLEEKSYNTGVTLGHRIKVGSDYEDQLIQARRVAAKKAAELPRGANSRIGRAGESTLQPASKNTANDPQTAVRIARFHGWDGARTGIEAVVALVAGAPAASPTAGVAVAGPAIARPTLIEITPDMQPDEVRKARIANSKAEAAYNKAVKAAASGAPASAASPAAAAAPQTTATASAPPAAAGIEPPVLIEITDDMLPEDIRKARVANAKAQSAYNKALKAAGVTPGQVSPVAEATVEAAPVAEAPSSVAAVGIEPPALIEITDNMAPEDIRKARVANAKAQAAYNKALKAAGIDPSVASSSSTTPAAPPAPAEPPAETVVAETSTSSTQGGLAAAAAAGIEPPELIEITDGMAPEEIRRARVENAKAQAAYNKALKAAGIDPATVK